MVRTVPALAAAVALVASGAQAAPESRYTHYDQSRCTELHPAAGEVVGDEVGFRCPGVSGVPMWVYYFDSTRLHLGFGRVGNIAGTFGVDRDDGQWPIEWRGEVRAGRFTPYAVIVRLRSPDPTVMTTELVIWKLNADGTSCITAHIDTGPRQNALARATADNRRAPCEAPADRL